jgi:transcriptional regulator with XRE-family HTH domain
MTRNGKPQDYRRKLKRLLARMTRRELADEIGVTVGAVDHWTRGLRKPSGPSKKAIDRLLQA